MTRETSILELAPWLQSPPGRYLLAWEQARFDEAVADVFGFRSLQLGLPQLEALRNNRMPNRWCALDELQADTMQAPPLSLQQPGLAAALQEAPPRVAALDLLCEFDALPFPSQSLDLVLMPHTLELADDPHAVLREVERVLMPEGRVIISGFNPSSLWGLRQGLGHWRQRLGGHAGTFVPETNDFIGLRRLRDWLRLLGLEPQHSQFGAYRLPARSQAWYDRMGWLERTGARWWPVFGAVYFCVAIKRVPAIRMVGLGRSRKMRRATAPVAVANRQFHRTGPGDAS